MKSRKFMEGKMEDYQEIVYFAGESFYSSYDKETNRQKLFCPKNKAGFEITLYLGGSEEKKKQAYEAIKNFYLYG